MTVFRWDIDKTYLETDFETLSGLWQAATESASEKVATDGVIPLIHSLQRDPHARQVFVSGSPKQMRSVLLQKFALDGVEVDRIILKDSLKALRKGRFGDIKSQFGHKLPSLLEDRIAHQGTEEAKQEYLFGDDVEQDALIYLTYQLIVHGKMQWRELKSLAKSAGVYFETLDRLQKAITQIEIQNQVVQRIFIRLTKHHQPQWMSDLRPHITPIHTWSQAACILFIDGLLGWEDVLRVVEDEGISPTQLGNLVQDLQVRGQINGADAKHLFKILNSAHQVLPLPLGQSNLSVTTIQQAYRSIG